MSKHYEEMVPLITDPDALTSGDLIDIAHLILAVGQYRTVEDCARDIVRSVQRLQWEKDAR